MKPFRAEALRGVAAYRYGLRMTMQGLDSFYAFSCDNYAHHRKAYRALKCAAKGDRYNVPSKRDMMFYHQSMYQMYGRHMTWAVSMRLALKRLA